MIQIDENWRIERVPFNLVLSKRKKVAEKIDGKTTGRFRDEWVEVGYFGSLHSLFMRLLEEDATAGDSIEEFNSRLEAMGEKILKAIEAHVEPS